MKTIDVVNALNMLFLIDPNLVNRILLNTHGTTQDDAIQNHLPSLAIGDAGVSGLGLINSLLKDGQIVRCTEEDENGDITFTSFTFIDNDDLDDNECFCGVEVWSDLGEYLWNEECEEDWCDDEHGCCCDDERGCCCDDEHGCCCENEGGVGWLD